MEIVAKGCEALVGTYNGILVGEWHCLGMFLYGNGYMKDITEEENHCTINKSV